MPHPISQIRSLRQRVSGATLLSCPSCVLESGHDVLASTNPSETASSLAAETAEVDTNLQMLPVTNVTKLMLDITPILFWSLPVTHANGGVLSQNYD